eukprot:Nk52_evm46s554 gene=Nk52_evmTU46s554
MSQFDYLVVVDFATNSSNPGGDRMNADEIILFPWLVYDIRPGSGCVCDERQIFVKPEWELTIPASCTNATGISIGDVASGPVLFNAIEQFENYLYANLASQNASFCLMTKSEWDLRDCLLQEASAKGIKLSPHYHMYFDIRREFAKRYPQSPPMASINEIADVLGIHDDSRVKFGLSQCRLMGAIISRLLMDNHIFVEPEIIPESDDFIDGLDENGLAFGDNEGVVEDDGGCVVRLRGLPWQASDDDITNFFSGIAIAEDGIVICVNNQGRPIGEAYVTFIDNESKALAMERDHSNMGRRYIEVFNATLVESETARKQRASARTRMKAVQSVEPNTILRLRGLPYSCSVEDIAAFFTGMNVRENGIYLTYTSSGRASGEAYVLFHTEEGATEGLALNKEMIGNRYVELFRSSPDEFNFAINKYGASTSTEGPRNGRSHTTSGGDHEKVVSSTSSTGSGKSELVGVRMRGLPYSAADSDIQSFFGSLKIVSGGLHILTNDKGRPTGEALVEFVNPAVCEKAMEKHREMIGQRYIEIFRISKSELQSRLGSHTVRGGKSGQSHGRGGNKGGEGKVAGAKLSAASGCTLKMRGLPYSATTADIVDFFADFGVDASAVTIGTNHSGRPSGEAFVVFSTPEDALRAKEGRNKCNMGSRYIEIFVN